MNTKERHKEILNVAAKAIEAAGGVVGIDAMPKGERIAALRELAAGIVEETGCTIETARRNVAQAMRRARYGVMQDRWGGPRPNQTGRPPMDPAERRVRISTRLAPGSKELAQAIAEVLELPAWGHAVDRALVRWVEGDRELKIKLAHMGIIVKAIQEDCEMEDSNES
jgi:hypothetical protein